MKKVYYDIADNFVKDLEKNSNKSIEINEKENKIKIENEIIKYEEKILELEVFLFHILLKTKQLLIMMEMMKN